jgi:hypothetical protein
MVLPVWTQERDKSFVDNARGARGFPAAQSNSGGWKAAASGVPYGKAGVMIR